MLIKNELKTIIAGSRNCTHYDDLLRAIDVIGWRPSVILSGGARGVDAMGERWASENNIMVQKYPAEWDKYGKAAGYRRNVQMAENADALLSLWDFKSRGTKHMIDICTKKCMVIYVWKVAP